MGVSLASDRVQFARGSLILQPQTVGKLRHGTCKKTHRGTVLFSMTHKSLLLRLLSLLDSSNRRL